MVIEIYHGSENRIEKPIYGYGKRYNDYGLGFYCTQEKELAKEWSVSFNKNGYANLYQLDTDDLKILNLQEKKYCILHWLAILLVNREFDITSLLAKEAKLYIIKNFLINYEDYDVIVGYRADDSYFSFAQDFLNGNISYRQLNNAMHLGKLGLQVVLKSKKSFSHIKFLDAEKALAIEYYGKKIQRDLKARNDYFNNERSKRKHGDLFITEIIDEEIKPYDSRLQ